MNNKLISTGLIYGSMLLTPVIALANVVGLSLNPYGGIEFGTQKVGFKDGYGGNLFNKQLPKASLFAGIKFNDYFGIECGYETTTKGITDKKIVYGDSYLGRPASSRYALLLDQDEYAFIKSKAKLSGWHLGITGSYKLFEKSNHNLQLIGYVGIKDTTVKLIARQYKFNHVNVIDDTFDDVFRKRKILAKFSVGLQYFPCKNFGIRTLASWENTAGLNPTREGPRAPILQAKLKNSVSYSIGVIFKK